MASQPDGGYPRLNGSMMNSGQQYTNMIVSLVGRFNSPPSGESIQFECCDQVSVTVSLEQGELPQDMASQPEMFYELIGQVDESNKFMLFVARELSSDMDMAVYNQMIEVQNNPKFKHYFGGDQHQIGSPMATN